MGKTLHPSVKLKQWCTPIQRDQTTTLYFRQGQHAFTNPKARYTSSHNTQRQFAPTFGLNVNVAYRAPVITLSGELLRECFSPLLHTATNVLTGGQSSMFLRNFHVYFRRTDHGVFKYNCCHTMCVSHIYANTLRAHTKDESDPDSIAAGYSHLFSDRKLANNKAFSNMATTQHAIAALGSGYRPTPTILFSTVLTFQKSLDHSGSTFNTGTHPNVNWFATRGIDFQ